jgi:uncharacterized protein YraI
MKSQGLSIDAAMISAPPAPSSRVRAPSARRSVKLGRLTRSPLFIAAVAMWLASAFSARAEYVCLPRASDDLKLHTGPGPRFPGQLMKNGTVVTVIKPRQGDWLEVQTAEGQTGWAHAPGVCAGTGPKR